MFSKAGEALVGALSAASPTEHVKVVDPACNRGCRHIAHNRQRNLPGEQRLSDVEAFDCCDNPPSHSSTQVQYIPHLSHGGPMTCAKEFKPCGEDSKDNYSRVLLFFGISKNECLTADSKTGHTSSIDL